MKIIVPVVCVVSAGLISPQMAKAAKNQIFVPIVVQAWHKESSNDIAAAPESAYAFGSPPQHLGLINGVNWTDNNTGITNRGYAVGGSAHAG